MSKALRVVTEDLHNTPSLPNAFANWHRFMLDMHSVKPPCYVEFMKLSECLGNKPASGCSDHYWSLMQCLHREGISGRASGES
tara:strand:- start:1086 stop:1334 length:249 start_codon:yes stop_codon:yes gene_type:complete